MPTLAECRANQGGWRGAWSCGYNGYRLGLLSPGKIHMSNVKRWLAAMLSLLLVAAGAPALAQDALKFTEAWFPDDCGVLKLRVKDPGPVCGFVSVPLP